jgi:glycosyltransferase involved in cell wall biosynthesis
VTVAPENCDIPLYHLGNNSLHAAIYHRALRSPGVVVLHDAVLHHFLLGRLDERAYIEEFVYNYGEWSRSLAASFWKARASSGSDPGYFAYPLLRRIAEKARAVVVHNPAAARLVREHAPCARVVEIPHLFVRPPLPMPAEIIRYRAQLGLKPGDFVFGIFGYLRESKRLLPVLQVFERVHRELPATALLVAGQFVSQDLEKAAAPLLEGAGVIRLPHLSEREFWMAASAVDACISLRYPAAGETSGVAIRLMGIGKPVMLTDAPECAAISGDACLRVACGAGERESLWEHMVLLTLIHGAASAVGQRGAAHVEQHHGVKQCAEAYWKLLNEVAV